MSDLLLDYMKRHNIPITREKYLALNYGSDYTGEEVLEVPEELDNPAFLEGAQRLMDYDPKQPRAPKGSSIGGQWVAAGEAIPEEKLSKIIQEDLSHEVGDEHDDQPHNDADELIAAAKKAEPAFRKTVEEIAEAVGGKPMFPPGSAVKGKPRLVEKAQLDYGGKVSEVKDVLRATIAADTIEGARKAAATFITRFSDRIVRVKDKIARVESGYRDILINYRTEDGLVTEVQFNAIPMLEAKSGDGHKLYEKIRTGNIPEQQIFEFTKQMDEIYNAAYLRAGNGKWKKK